MAIFEGRSEGAQMATPVSSPLAAAVMERIWAGPPAQAITLSDAIRRAKAGSAEDAIFLLCAAAACMRSQRNGCASIPAELADYLAEGFETFARGGPRGPKLDRALNVSGRNRKARVGNSRFKNEQRNALIAHFASAIRAGWFGQEKRRNYLKATADFISPVLSPPRRGSEWTAQSVADAIKAHKNK